MVKLGKAVCANFLNWCMQICFCKAVWFRFRHFIEPGAYDYAFTPQPDAAAIRCVLLSGERRMAEGTLLVAADPARGEA